ncbi:MAG: hypothetical protein PCFJNLEI_01377 [Verrucomicrobiae bacterium]|nr:hypothetical protein [Verrucomicrobiae bacterium]
MDTIEIKYSSPSLGGGYVTETIQCQGTQQAFNLIRSRVPDAVFNGIVIHPSPQPTTPPTDPHRRW